MKNTHSLECSLVWLGHLSLIALSQTMVLIEERTQWLLSGPVSAPWLTQPASICTGLPMLVSIQKQEVRKAS